MKNNTTKISLNELQLNDIMGACVDPTQHIVITCKEKPTLAVISYEEYEQLKYFQSLLKKAGRKLLPNQKDKTSNG